MDKEGYLGAIMFGNGKRHITVGWPLKNLIVRKVSCGLTHSIAATMDAIYGWG